MKKEAIIDLIESDLKEIATLVETFREPDRIAQDFIELLRQKCEGVNREISLLNYWSTENLTESTETELVAQVAHAAKATEKPQPTEPKPAIIEPKVAEPKKVDVPDYFAPELDKMADPLAGAKFTNTTAEPTAKTEVKVVTVSPTPVVETHEKPKPVVKEAPAPAAEKVAEPKTAHAKPVAQPKPAHAKPAETKKTVSNAADIATYGTPVSDITKAIGINDRFLYQRELFNGNKQALDEAIAAINLASSYNQAYIYLKQFGWDESDPTVEAFLKAVHRRFI